MRMYHYLYMCRIRETDLHCRNPEHANVVETIGNETCDVVRQEVKIQPNHTETHTGKLHRKVAQESCTGKLLIVICYCSV